MQLQFATWECETISKFTASGLQERDFKRIQLVTKLRSYPTTSYKYHRVVSYKHNYKLTTNYYYYLLRKSF